MLVAKLMSAQVCKCRHRKEMNSTYAIVLYLAASIFLD